MPASVAHNGLALCSRGSLGYFSPTVALKQIKNDQAYFNETVQISSRDLPALPTITIREGLVGHQNNSIRVSVF
jgi:hypothetical protein